jgi:hypothetical protein
MAQTNAEEDGRTDEQTQAGTSPSQVDGLSEHPVELGEPGDYIVPIEVEGLPDGTVAVDFYNDTPQLVIEQEATGVEMGVEREETCQLIKFEVSNE